MGSDLTSLSIGQALRREVEKTYADWRKYKEKRDAKTKPMIKCKRCGELIFREDAIRTPYKLGRTYPLCFFCARKGRTVNIGKGVA
jgi:hypothetical protein